MKPPYTISSRILNLVSEVAHKIGEVNASFLTKQSPELRKQNRIRTIQASLAIEGNTLAINQVTAILDKKRVIGPPKDIAEVNNAIQVYAQLSKYHPYTEKAFLSAHKTLMQGLVKHPGKYRHSGVGIVKGQAIAHLAPPAAQVPVLMKQLFQYLRNDEEAILIKSCVFHYEVEFIHPFADGNGRMGRLWQTLILMQQYPVFEYLPFETLISKHQQEYYQALSISDKQGESTYFIVFMLGILRNALDELLKERTGPISSIERIGLFLKSGARSFTRKDYMAYFKTVSSATASRDLQLAVQKKLIKKQGEKNQTSYQVV
ncbi:MAG TPA: cell filamentation protein Fic [Chitinophagaceae bacterium]|nr:cell filamentation protein Fic [Chitinophagaceae bacterium]